MSNPEPSLDDFLDIKARAISQLDQLQANLDQQKEILARQQESIYKIRDHWDALEEEARRNSQK
jgi:hypothetical protein